MLHVHTHTHDKDGTHVKRLERLCDAVVRLESFPGSDKEQNPLYKDYHGERGKNEHCGIILYSHFDAQIWC